MKMPILEPDIILDNEKEYYTPPEYSGSFPLR
jgi:hypothetical protein